MPNVKKLIEKMKQQPNGIRAEEGAETTMEAAKEGVSLNQLALYKLALNEVKRY